VDVVRTAERGVVDFVTFDDGLTPQRRRRPEIEPRWLAGRPDAVLLASRVAPATSHVGLVPVASVTYAEPSRLAEAIATLDVVSHGRAGWQPRISPTAQEAALFGRRDVDREDLFTDASRTVEVVRGLWGGQEPVALGQPVVAALAHVRPAFEFAARSADLVFVTPKDDQQLPAILREVEDAGGTHLRVYADVFITSGGVGDLRSDAYVFDRTAEELVEVLVRWQGIGVDGVRLRPAVTALDLPFIVDEVMPRLRAAADLRPAYVDGETLRQRLGLPVADDRYQKAVPT
jgi:alkanesulfonate monooxygenase SsuD/methylene tetrahydromethanopterin reductase-like flavin-dependent oxidoreductase (luciferase family)